MRVVPAKNGWLMPLILSGKQPPIESLQEGSVLSAMLDATLAVTPVAMAFWFAPVIAAWNRIGAAQSLFYSFFAVWRNWRAFFVYGAVLALAGAVFLIILTFAALLVQGRMQGLHSLALILFLVSWPTLLASFYASYR